MSRVKRLALAATGMALLAVVLAATPAQAQLSRRFGAPGVGGTLNPANYYDPYGSSRQAAFNIGLYGRAISQVPPYALGYNPYVTSMPLWSGGGGYGTIMNNTLGAYPGYAGSPGYGGGGYGGG